MLTLKDIIVSFRSERQEHLFRSSRIEILHGLSLDIPRGSCLGILGESGSGKSTLGRVMTGLLKPDSGQVLLDGLDVYKEKKGKKKLQEKLSVVFQDYTTSANPRFRISEVVLEGVRAARRKELTVGNEKDEVVRLLELTGLDASYMDRFPHELSGGQLQRACIARAIASRPEIILFDEAVSSLDAHTQVQIMDLLISLKEELSLTYVFITHDLTSVTYLCDEVLFLYKGNITERRSVDDLSNVKDQYARALLDSIIVYDAGGAV